MTIRGLFAVTILGLLAIALEGILVGLKLKNSELLEAVGFDGQAFGACLGVSFLALLFIGLTVLLVLKPSKFLSILYGILLFFTFLSFLAFGFGLLYARG